MTTPKPSTLACAPLCRCLPLLVLLVAGCQTAKVDWNARVGSFAYDQAVVELGPPDRVAELTDRTKVAEWLSQRGQASFYLNSFDMGFSHRAYGLGWHHGYVSPARDRFLRLIFSPDGKLASWQWISR
jgi:hypothetical protein